MTNYEEVDEGVAREGVSGAREGKVGDNGRSRVG